MSFDRAWVIQRIREFADADPNDTLLSRRVETDLRAFEYEFDDVCDFLCDICEADLDGPIVPSEWEPSRPVAIFVKEYAGATLYVKVVVNKDHLFVLSFKPDGSIR